MPTPDELQPISPVKMASSLRIAVSRKPLPATFVSFSVLVACAALAYGPNPLVFVLVWAVSVASLTIMTIWLWAVAERRTRRRALEAQRALATFLPIKGPVTGSIASYDLMDGMRRIPPGEG